MSLAVSEYFLDINPEPWAIGKAFAMRGRGGAGISPNKKLVAYQKAVKEAFEVSRVKRFEENVRVEFYFSRAVEKLTYGNRKTSANYADATNLQKALEDALQGILYENDSQVLSIQSTIVAQGPEVTPGIFIRVLTYSQMNMHESVLSFNKIREEFLAKDITPKQDNTW